MSKPTDYRPAVRETMDRVDELFGAKRPHNFGQLEDGPSDEELEASKDRRLKDVTDRAKREKYGFLRTIKQKVFGKKDTETEPSVEREPRSYEERFKSIVDRAKRNG